MKNFTKQFLSLLILCLSFSPLVQATCGNGTLTMTITFDGNPQQVAWQIKDIQDNTMAWFYSTSNYSSGDVIVETIPYLPAGDYALIVFDSGMNGLCCSNGTGSFELKDGQQNVLLNGSTFEGSIVQTFCVGNTNNDIFDLTPPTASVLTANNPTATTIDLSWTDATDNDAVLGYVIFINDVYAGDVYYGYNSVTVPGLTPNTTYDFFIAARDYTGNFSPKSNIASATTTMSAPVSTATVIHEAFFENNSWDGWVDGGNDASLYSGSRSYEGTGSILLQDNSGVKSSMTSPALDLSGSDSVNITFQYYTLGFEQGEDFFIKWKQGNSFINVAQFVKGTDFNANGFYEATVTLDANNYSFGAADQFRIQADASDNSDEIYVDQVVVTTYSTSRSASRARTPELAVGRKEFFKGEETNVAFENLKERNLADERNAVQNQVTLFPNPATHAISLQGIESDNLDAIMIYDNYGKIMLQTKETSDIDVSHMPAGTYHLYLLNKNKTKEVLRFMKMD